VVVFICQQMSPEYVYAEKEYLNAETKEQKIRALKKMISHAPKHKGGENLRAHLKRKLQNWSIQMKKKQKRKINKDRNKKEDMQAAIIGLTKTGNLLCFLF